MRQILFLCLFLVAIKPAWSGSVPPKIPGLNAIYGVDDRELVTSKSPKEIQKIAEAIAMIVSVDNLDRGFFKTAIKAFSLKENINMCVSENFVSRPSISSCTGFLIAPNIIATAGHCFETEEDCATKKIIFGVDAKKQSKKGYSVSESDIFSCEKIIAQEQSESQDFAIVQLDRIAKKRMPLKLNTESKIAADAQVFMIGHPMGLPQMLSKKSIVSDNSSDTIFKTNLDSFEGNSGSPVINSQTLLVEGILVNGQEDFVQDLEIGCYRNKVYESAGGEGVFRINFLLPFLN